MNDLVHNERAKLTATWLNSIGSGIMVTGVVAPVLAAYLNFAGATRVATGALILTSGACFVASLGLHLIARTLLGRLR